MDRHAAAGPSSFDNKKMKKLGWKPKHTSEQAVKAAAKIVVSERLRKYQPTWVPVQTQ